MGYRFNIVLFITLVCLLNVIHGWIKSCHENQNNQTVQGQPRGSVNITFCVTSYPKLHHHIQICDLKCDWYRHNDSKTKIDISTTVAKRYLNYSEYHISVLRSQLNRDDFKKSFTMILYTGYKLNYSDNLTLLYRIMKEEHQLKTVSSSATTANIGTTATIIRTTGNFQTTLTALLATIRNQKYEESHNLQIFIVVPIIIVIIIIITALIVGVLVFGKRGKTSTATGNDGEDDGQANVYANTRSKESAKDAKETTNQPETLIVESESGIPTADEDSGRLVTDEGLVYITVAHASSNAKVKAQSLPGTSGKEKPEESVEYVTINFDKTGNIPLPTEDDVDKNL